VGCVLTVASNEPVNGLGDGDTAPDWQVIDPHHLLLRSERSGKGNGRIYTITVTCTDPAGNTVVRTTTVKVPKNQAKISTVVDSPAPTVTVPKATAGGTSGNRTSVYVPYLNLPSKRAETSNKKKASSARKKKSTRTTSAR
jgi:hypothetical protein